MTKARNLLLASTILATAFAAATAAQPAWSRC